MQTEITAVTILDVVMKFAKFCSLDMGICIKAIIVLSSYFGILQSASVYLRLKGRNNFTDNIVPINVVGVTTNEITHPDLATYEHENNGLQCITDKLNCCRVGNIRIGEWHFPDGTLVPILDDGYNRATTFFRNRGDNDSTINLNRINNSVMSPTGLFCCMVPDSREIYQHICANITAVTVTIMSIPPATSVAGEHFTLQCSAEGVGDFLTRIEWLNTEHISGINIQNNGSSVQLQFIPLQDSHSGVYTCQATVGDTVFNKSHTLYVETVTMAPSSPRYFKAVSDMTTVRFSWGTPLHPRAVANYTLMCASLAEGVDPLIITYTEVRSYTLGGFRPATVYNCSIFATNVIGNSASSVITVTTVDESSQFHLWLIKIDNCTEWMVADDGQKLNDISFAIVDSIENSCQCGFIRDRITNKMFQCTDDAQEAVVYAATIHGTASVNSSELLSLIKQWASDGAMVTVLHEILNISDMGPTKGECCTEMTETKQVTISESSSNKTQAKNNDHMMLIIIGGGSAAGVVLIIVIIIMMVAVIMKCKHRKRGKIRIHETECVQEEKELTRYENLCASRIQQGVYIEECDYGEIKAGQQLQEHEDVIHHHSSTNEYVESTHGIHINEPEYGNIMKSRPDDQSQATPYQHSLSPQNKLAAEKYNDSNTNSYQSAYAKHQNVMPSEGHDVNEEVYDDIQPHQPQAKNQYDPYHPETMEDCMTNKSDGQNNYKYTAIPQSSAAGSTRYQPLLSRESDYENHDLKDYNSINASQQQDDNGSDKEYQYVTTKPRYYYRPSVKQPSYLVKKNFCD